MLRDEQGVIREYLCVVWTRADAKVLNVEPWVPKHQTFWEFATLLLALLVWAHLFEGDAIPVLGDSIGALQAALKLQGRGPMLAIAREISWRAARRIWCLHVVHLPAETNNVVDALSRVQDPKDPEHLSWPSTALGAAERAKTPKLKDVWLARPS